MPHAEPGAGSAEAASAPAAPRIGMVWARATNGVIGADGALPWRIPEDSARFREVTAGSTVVMGRGTWDSLPARFRPLPGRRNIVLTRHRAWEADGARRAGSLDDALAMADGPIWIIGGGAVYAAGMAVAERIAETVVDLAPSGDTVAPSIGEGWILTREGPWRRSSSGLRYRFLDWRRG